MKILVDFHHSSLLRSYYLTLEGRLGHKVYRPIGLEWFEEGYWAINDQRDTAEQFLGLNQIPVDGTPRLNDVVKWEPEDEGVYICGTPEEPNRAATLEYFKNNKFDIVIASIPAHIKPFQEMIAKYQPQAKLVVQIGNEWPESLFAGLNVMASVKPRRYGNGTNVLFYHQEFDTNIFKPAPMQHDKPAVYSFINILQSMERGWADFQMLEKMMPRVRFESFGGQCRDGNVDGRQNMADKIHEANFIFHVKDNGDGYGHVLYNAYACGRPVIIRGRDYKHKLGGELLAPGTFIDLDECFPRKSMEIQAAFMRPGLLDDMGKRAAERFKEVVNFDKEGKEINEWLKHLL